MRAISANNNHGTVKDVPYEKKTLICLPSGWRSRESRSQCLNHTHTQYSSYNLIRQICQLHYGVSWLGSVNHYFHFIFLLFLFSVSHILTTKTGNSNNKRVNWHWALRQVNTRLLIQTDSNSCSKHLHHFFSIFYFDCISIVWSFN